MKSKPSRKKLEAPLLDPSKRSRQRLSYTLPIKVDWVLQHSAERIGMNPERYIQTAIMDANRHVFIWDGAEEREHEGYIRGEIKNVLRAKRTGETKPAPEQAAKMVEVIVRLPKALATKMEEKCESDSITLAEAIGDLAQEALSQQFDDNGSELEMVRRISSARTVEELQ